MIEPGDTVGYELPMVGRGQVQRGPGFERTSFDDDTIYHLIGPRLPGSRSHSSRFSGRWERTRAEV